MSTPSLSRDALVKAVSGQLGQELSTVTVLFHAIVAERLGVGPTDHKAYTLIVRHGPLTAGTLAKMTGLTTGAITGVIDRLEHAGYVQRTNDPHDRRKVLVAARSTEPGSVILSDIFPPLLASMTELCADFSDDELLAVHRFMGGAIDVLQQHIDRLSMAQPADDAP